MGSSGGGWAFMADGWQGDHLRGTTILDAIGFHRRSGRVQVVVDGDAYAFHLAAGHVIYATSSQRTLRLGHLLLQRGALQPLYLHDVLRGRRSLDRSSAIGGVLVRDGAVTLEELAAGVEEQAVEVLARVLALNDATFMYHGDEPVPAGIEIVPLDTVRVVEEAERRLLERTAAKVLQRLLPAQDAALYLTSSLAPVSYLLSDAELLVALTIDRGGASLERLGTSLPLDPITLKRTLITLIERGLVSVGQPPISFDF